jgi:hypothetical protein
MAQYMRWQRGMASLVSVAVAFTILAIVVAGTAASMIYGREALQREERYKVAAYILRGVIEQEQAALQMYDEATGSRYCAPRVFGQYDLNLASDLHGVRVVHAMVYRDQIDSCWAGQDHSVRPDYYLLTAHIRWREPDFAENPGWRRQMDREISFRTAVVVRRNIG